MLVATGPRCGTRVRRGGGSLGFGRDELPQGVQGVGGGEGGGMVGGGGDGGEGARRCRAHEPAEEGSAFYHPSLPVAFASFRAVVLSFDGLYFFYSYI